GPAGRNAAVQFHTVDDADGTVAAADVAWAVEATAHHHPRPSVVCIENTHMPANGAPWALGRLREVAAAAAAGGLAVHLDGARLFNTEVATRTPAATWAAPASTVMCCLSKGLCAPVGSLLAGPGDLIEAARGERQRMGGGMRQAGVLAAAGLVALTMVDRLADDHRRARRLAEVVAERWPGSGLDPATVHTNVVAFSHPAPLALLEHLADDGVLAGTIAPGVVRLVTHHDVDDDALGRAVKALGDAS
ncbi:MAG TPA: beta-eliminating lyase-related protein, partial [Acidimicrobiales bacterium]|nr:beta-eliminating lyase-related protein [Acidimicrobiales bacterium]